MCDKLPLSVGLLQCPWWSLKPHLRPWNTRSTRLWTRLLRRWTSCSTRLVSLLSIFCVQQNKERYLFDLKKRAKSNRYLFHIEVGFAFKFLSPRSTSFTWYVHRHVTGVVQAGNVFLYRPASMEKNRFTNQFCWNRLGQSFLAHLFPYSVWQHISPHWAQLGQS